MSSSRTFNYISIYSILKTLTSFISHCFACHQWQSWTGLFPGCLPKCLLCAGRFLSGLHPTYHFSFKRLSPDMLLANQLRKALFMQNYSQAGQRRHAHLQGRWDRRRELWFSPVVQLTKHWTSFLYLVCDLSSDGTGETLVLVPVPFSSVWDSPNKGCCLDFFPFSAKFSPRKAIFGSPPAVLLQATGYPLRSKSVFCATMAFS